MKVSTLGNPRRMEAAAIVLAILLALVALALLPADSNFENLALGEAVDGPRPLVDGFPVHCDGFPLDDVGEPTQFQAIDDCVEGARERHATHVGLWLGNSQTTSINRYKTGDRLASGTLHKGLVSHGIDMLTISYPNANQQEHLGTYAYLKARLPLTVVVLNLVFDDFREDGIRGRLLPTWFDQAASETTQSFDVGRGIRERLQDQKSPTADDSAAPVTLQDRTEAFLDGWLSTHFIVWAHRPEARGRLLSHLYHFRNWVLGITPQSTRRTMPARYARNRAAVEAMLEDGAQSGISMVGFIAPLRNDVRPPYDPDEYSRFVRDMSELFSKHKAIFSNLEQLVPAEHWGRREGHLDFMHFAGPGHELMANALMELVVEAHAK